MVTVRWYVCSPASVLCSLPDVVTFPALRPDAEVTAEVTRLSPALALQTPCFHGRHSRELWETGPARLWFAVTLVPSGLARPRDSPAKK